MSFVSTDIIAYPQVLELAASAVTATRPTTIDPRRGLRRRKLRSLWRDKQFIGLLIDFLETL